MTKELKPCPFQKDGETHDVRFVELKPGYGQIGCADCGFWFPSEEVLTKAEAIERWNTRYKRTCKMVLCDDENPNGDANGYVVRECDHCGWRAEYQADSEPSGWCAVCGAEVLDD